MFDRASKKLGLEQAVLGTFEKETEDDKPSQKEMEQLLKKGAYALLEDDNDEVTKEFCADDIESILAKRTRTRVVEGAKTASWLNKQGMVVSKSKFTAEASTLDMDDPLFWQKVMPDFVTPSIMVKRLKDLEDEIEGKVRGPGRGRWRQKRLEEAQRKAEMEAKATANGETNLPSEAGTASVPTKNEEHTENKDDAEDNEEAAEQEDEEFSDEEDGKSKKLSRGQLKKVHKFMNELKSMMLTILDEDDEEEETLSPEEKSACQKLLLTVSVKQKMFTEEQRSMARKFLKRVEGDRRRRCRTSDQRSQPGVDPTASPAVREELMIRGKQRKKRRKRAEVDDDDANDTAEPTAKRSKRNVDAEADDDGYIQHTDSEGDWSDVNTDIYDGNDKDKISRKEAARRRAWLADEDAASAAGRAWPVFPRPLVRKVLTTVLEKVIKNDQDSGGVFSVPVPKDDFPEYYEQIRKPMDYGTMKKKLENGEYRSAQSMQKDFLLIMQNCRKFNADSSDIVKEAREQHLLRPQYLKEAAAEHNLFLAEDGSVLEIVEEKKKGASKKKKSESGDKV